MGARGKQSTGPKRAPRVDARPHSSLRGIAEMSVPYLDLVNGEPAYWSDPDDPERLAAWTLWRDRILARWHRPGWRPAAWVRFDLPLLVDKVRPWRRDVLERWNATADKARQISLAEFVYAFKATSEDERELIRETWRGELRLADGDRRHPAADDVPPWFDADGPTSP